MGLGAVMRELDAVGNLCNSATPIVASALAKAIDDGFVLRHKCMMWGLGFKCMRTAVRLQGPQTSKTACKSIESPT